MLYVYLPIVRDEVYQFVNLWNVHQIQYQKNRPELPTGKPIVLYFIPPEGIDDYGLIPDRTILDRLKADVSEYGKILLTSKINILF